MKISLEWILDFVDINGIDVNEVINTLTMLGLEVEYKQVFEKIKDVVVGKILKIEQHPTSNHLKVCQVYDGTSTYYVVCGANNINENMKIPYARVGSILPHNIKISKRSFFGIESYGMICSAEELGIENKSDGVLILPDDLKEGLDVNNILRLPDYVLDLAITPNRGDCLSIRGVARELSAAFNKKFIDISFDLKESTETSINEVSLVVKNGLDCPCYIGRLVKGIKIKESPLWMRLRLMKLGLKPINNVVDMSNYVMFECGQPLHTFDLNKTGKTIYVKRANEGTKITLLDGRNVDLNRNFLVISDENNPIAIAGVMGGVNSCIDENSCDIFIECACFDPYLIRKTTKAINTQTEASYRFERGIDIADMDRIIDYASYLLKEVAGGNVITNKVIYKAKQFQNKEIIFDYNRINKLLGTNLEEKQQIEILNRLNIDIKKDKKQSIACIPSYRNDLSLDADLAEEVARVIGLDNIPFEKAKVFLESDFENKSLNFMRCLKNKFSSLGFNEVINYSFTDSKFLSLFDDVDNFIFIKNPLSEELNVLRTLVFPSLIKDAILNQNEGLKDIRFFEVANVFAKSLNQQTKLSNKVSLPLQKMSLGILVTETFWPLNWAYKSGIDTFYYLKGIIENFFQSIKLDISFTKSNYKYLHPGKSCNFILNGQILGFMGQLHPEVIEKLDLFEPYYIAELFIDKICENRMKVDVKYKKYSIYPIVYKDLSIVVDEAVSFEDLKELIYKTSNIIANVVLFDVYRDEKIGLNKKSLAFRITFHDFSKTLTDDEVGVIFNKIIEKAKTTYGAILR